MVMKTIIIDDEPFAITLLQEELAKVPFVEVVGTFGSPILAISYLQSHAIDLVFSDISMPDINGLQLIKAVNSKALFILATAHREFAVDGFELNVVDYLVKPYGFERLFKALLKAQELFQLKSGEQVVAEAVVETPAFNLGHIFVKSDYKDVKVDLEHITYVQALKDYIKIFKDGSDKPLVTQMNLKAIEDLLPSEVFCRVHRSYIVNIKKVNAYNKTELFIEQTEIPIGDFYRNSFLKVFKG